jgi:hypothetical protein
MSATKKSPTGHGIAFGNEASRRRLISRTSRTEQICNAQGAEVRTRKARMHWEDRGTWAHGARGKLDLIHCRPQRPTRLLSRQAINNVSKRRQ